jgi:hypothetical protein
MTTAALLSCPQGLDIWAEINGVDVWGQAIAPLTVDPPLRPLERDTCGGIVRAAAMLAKGSETVQCPRTDASESLGVSRIG